MKVYLDDVRDTPKGWHRTYTAAETIELIKRGGVTELSLDHDLGFDSTGRELPNGHTVLKWLEQQIALIGDAHFMPKAIFIHSQNPVGAANMRATLESIYKRIASIDYEQT